MRNVAVIGANGFLGNKIVKALLDEGTRVTAVFNKNNSEIDKRAITISASDFLRSSDYFESIFFAIGNYASTHLELLQINQFLFEVVKKAGVNKLVYISSTNVYGSHSDVIQLKSSFNNPTLYAQSKISGEFIVSSLTNYIIIRFTYIYGPGITNSSFIPFVIKSAKQTKKVTLHGDGSRKQDYLYIDDAVDLCLKARECISNNIFIGATGISISNREVVEELLKHIDFELIYERAEIGDSYTFQPIETFKVLSWRPKVSFAEGIKNMI